MNAKKKVKPQKNKKMEKENEVNSFLMDDITRADRWSQLLDTVINKSGLSDKEKGIATHNALSASIHKIKTDYAYDCTAEFDSIENTVMLSGSPTESSIIALVRFPKKNILIEFESFSQLDRFNNSGQLIPELYELGTAIYKERKNIKKTAILYSSPMIIHTSDQCVRFEYVGKIASNTIKINIINTEEL